MHDSPNLPNRVELGHGAPVLACDVGGTTMKIAVVRADGAVTAVRRLPTPRGDAAAVEIVARLRAVLHEAGDERHVRAVGLSVPGLVDDAQGVALASSNLGWSTVPFRALAEDALGLPVAFGHDVRAAAHAEFEIGAARGVADAAVVVVGTGVSCALRIDGRDVLAGGFAGEIGHSIVTSERIVCSCGASGHLEGVASAEAIARRYTAEVGGTIDGSRGVLERAREGDSVAGRIWGEAIDALALGLAQLVSTTAPRVIVVGGGLAEAGDALFVSLRQRLSALMSVHRRPTVIPAMLGEDAGLIGTALAARELVAALSTR